MKTKNIEPPSPNRRKFCQNSGLFLAALALPPFSKSWSYGMEISNSSLKTISRKDLFSKDFNGDDLSRPHDILWNVPGYLEKKGGRPQPQEEFEIVVLGGGIAGLTCAYQLRDKKILILDQAPQMGGNAQGECYDDSLYSIGSAYINRPDPNSNIAALLEELGLLKKFRGESSTDTTVFYKGRFSPEYWKGATDPSAQDDFLKVQNKLKQIYETDYPEIPVSQSSGKKLSRSRLLASSSSIKQLDSLSFLEWCRQNFPDLHPHIMEYFQLYSWSSFAGSIDEISAAQMLNFLAAETGDIVAFPGGNAAITSTLIEKITQKIGVTNLRAGCMALDIQMDSQGVLVTYENEKGELNSVRSKKVIVSLPKFVARKIIPQLSADQSNAMAELTYRGYIVANIILDRSIPSPCFDLYSLLGEYPESPTAMHPSPRPFSDLCFGSWAQHDQSKHSVLTVYHALPYEGARQFLFSPASHHKYLNKIKEGLPPLFKAMNIDSKNIIGLRLTRWGHALPLAEIGLLASKKLDLARSPIENKIYFANQDNWANPSVECAMESAFLAVRQLTTGSI